MKSRKSQVAMSFSGTFETPEFEEFWNVYPKPDAKGLARRAYVAARLKVTHDVIMDGLRRYPFDSNPKYQPMPSTWLNQERWAYEPPRTPPTVMVDSRDKRPTSMDTMREIAGGLNGNRDHGFDIDGELN